MFKKYYLGEEGKKLQHAVYKAFKKAEPYDIDLEVHTGQQVKTIRHIGTPDQNEHGQVISLHGIVQDVSDFMKLQKDITESEQRLDTAIEGAKLGIWDSNLKKETTVTNKRWHEMLGYKTDEIGDPHALYQLFFNNLHPDDKPLIVNALNSLKKGVKENFELTLRVKNKSGEYFTILDKGRAVEFDSEGQVVRMIGSVLDITEQRELEQKLKESQFRLETAVEGANLGIWDANIRDETNIANDRWFEMIGYKPEEIEGNSFQFFFSRIHPEDGKKIMKEIKEIERGEKQSFEEIVRVKHKSGEYITILDKGTALEYDSEGLVTRMIGTHLDISELVSTQNRLQKSLREKELLIREVHHRVKNNLAILAGLLELDIFSKGENTVISDAIGRIRSIAFVHELLYQTESMVDVDFKSFMESYLNYIKNTFNLDNKVIIDAKIQSASLNVNEAVPLGLLINELMTNSIKHGVPDGGKIVIRFTFDKSDRNKHKFYYSDNGPGIDPEKMKNNSLGLELINTLLENLHAHFELKTEGKFELKAYFEPKEKGAFGNPLNINDQ